MRSRASGNVTIVVVLLGMLILVGVASVWWFRPKDLEPQPAEPPAPAWFTEIIDDSGIDFRHRFGPERRFYFPEIATGGVGTFDYDGDGRLDLYFVQGGDLDPSAPKEHDNRLYRNLGGMRFEDVTPEAGVGDRGYGMGCTAGDYDGDGDVDLYVTNVGANVLYQNQGNGTFADVTATAGVGDASWGSSAAFVDYDADGDLDLYVVNYLQWSIATEITCYSGSGERDYCGPNSYQAPAPDTLYRNDGNGTFTDVTQTSGIGKRFGNGLGVVCGDFNADGHIDVYVANDGLPNQLWINDGQGRFDDRSMKMGCSVNAEGKSEAGMGVAAIDVEHDGDLDLFLSHLRDETNTFYINNGDWFEDSTAAMGLARTSYEFTGFGLGFADFDHDGQLDLYVANGRVKRVDPALRPDDIYAEPNLLFVPDEGAARFKEFRPRGGTAEELLDTSRGAVFGDFDDDGDVDIAVANMNARPYLLRNDAAQGNWAMFRVLDRRGGYALHASLEFRVLGRTIHRRVQRAYSYCATNDPRVHVGIAHETQIPSVLVRWCSGEREEFGPFPANALHEIRQGTGRAVQ